MPDPSPPSAGFKLPAPGDIQAQFNAGESILNDISTQKWDDLATAGINGLQSSSKAGGIFGVVSGAVSAGAGAAGAVGTGAAAIGAFDGSLAGVSAAGPYAAVAAAVVAAIAALVSGLEQGYTGVSYIFPSAAGKGPQGNPSQTNAKWIQSWRPANAPTSATGATVSVNGYPIGTELYEYLAAMRPPKASKRANLYLYLMQQVASEVWREGVPVANEITASDIVTIYTSPNALAACGAFSAAGLPENSVPGVPGGTGWGAMFPASQSPNALLGGAVPLAAPVLWHWLDWHNINGVNQTDPSQQTYPFNLYYASGPPGRSGTLRSTVVTGANGAPIPLGVLHDKARLAMMPMPVAHGKTLSADEVLVRALQRAPDPLFFSADLYGSAPGGNFTVLYNVDLANAMATVMLMLSTGATTRSIVSELLVQLHVLVDQGALGYPEGDLRNASPGFRALLDDYMALAHAEDHDHGKATMDTVIAKYPDGFMGRAPARAVAAVTPGSAPTKKTSKPVTESKAQAAAIIASFVHLYLHI